MIDGCKEGALELLEARFCVRSSASFVMAVSNVFAYLRLSGRETDPNSSPRTLSHPLSRQEVVTDLTANFSPLVLLILDCSIDYTFNNDFINCFIGSCYFEMEKKKREVEKNKGDGTLTVKSLAKNGIHKATYLSTWHITCPSLSHV